LSASNGLSGLSRQDRAYLLGIEAALELPVRPPAGSPSIVIVLMNDMGWDDVGCYGLEIATPNIDARDPTRTP